MSLRVWLPLDGDLRNQGISNSNNIISTGSSVVNTGKIGKCMKITSNTDLQYTPNFNQYGLSLSGWFKINQNEVATVVDALNYTSTAYAPTGNLFGNTNYGGIGLIWIGNNHYSSGAFSYITAYAALRTPSVNQITAGASIEFDTWIHLTLTWDPTTHILSLYKNGNLINSKTFTAFTDGVARTLYLNYNAVYSGNGPTANIPLYCNDIRVYDNCLSAAEVKEIAQGLILHYKLDGGLFGNSNLYTGSEKFTGTWNGMGNWTTSSETYQNFVVKQKSTTWGGLSQNISCTQGDIFTISFYGKVDSGGTIRSVHRSNLGNVTTGLTILDGNFVVMGDYWIRTTDNGTQWKRYWATVQITGSDITYLQWRLENSVADKNFYVCGIKLEKGNTATPWCPADSEMNIDRTIIKDSSGYNNNGIINGNMSINSNTAKYNNAIVFNGSDNAIQIPFNDIIKTDDYTISVWTYKETIGTKSYQTILGGPSGFELEARSGSSTSPLYRIHNWGGGTTAYEFNKWNLFTFVRTINDSKLYVNGELKLTGTAGTIPTGNYFIGAWSNTTKQNYEGLMSDFRIYCTPLLDTDVKQLYNVGMKVDKSQNIHTFEINEKNINIFSSTPWTNNFNNHSPNTNPFTNYNSNNEPQFTTNSSSAGSDYIVITPGIYEWDYTVSINAGNQFYIGFERYDADKTSRSNAATVYQLGFKPSEDLIKKRFFGTVDLSTDGVNPIKYIALRILNGWSGTTSGVTGQATIHNFSLRLQSAATNPQLTKTGQLIGDEFKEYSNAKFYKDHIIEANHFIER